MSYYHDEDYEDDPEPVELPEVFLDTPGPCCICGQPCQNGCFACGRPVCYAPNYTDDSDCGSWLRDWWSNDAEEENAFLCNECLASIYGPAEQEEQCHV